MKLIQASAIAAVASAYKAKAPDGSKLRGNEHKHESEKDRELFLGGDGGGLEGIFGELEEGLGEMFGDGFGSGGMGMGGWGGDGDTGMGMGGHHGMGGHQGLGSHSFGSGGDDFFACTDSCTDDKTCESFMQMMSFDPTSKFEDACNSKCFPKVTLDMCGRLNCDSDEGPDEETEEAATTAVTRMGLMDLFDTDAAVRMMCNDCKFYSCCLDDGEVGDTTKYEACQVHLVDNAEEQALGNSVLDELANIFGEVVDGVADAMGMGDDEDGDGDVGLGSVLDQMLQSFGDAVEGFAEDFDLPVTWNFTVTDWGDGAVWSGTETASGVSVFGQVAGSFMCPDTCTNEDLCSDVFTGMAGPGIMEDACNAGCLPGPESCDDVCGTSAPDSTETAVAVERFIDFEAVTNMACKSCRFLTCCNGQQASDTDASVSKFDTCSELLPDPSELWTDTTDGDWTWEWDGMMDWIDSVDWSALAEDLGLSELFGDLQSLLDEALAGFDLVETPVTCNRDTCPIEGFCEMDVDLQTMDLGEVCNKNAFFDCGEGLEEACDAQCSDADGDNDGMKAPFCALCDLAKCCSTSEEEGKSFEDCALAALPEDVSAAIEDGSSNGASSSPPAADADEEGEDVASPEPSASADDAPVVAESTSDGSATPSAGTTVVEDAGDGSATAQSSDGEEEEEDSGDRPAAPAQSSSSESGFEFEASRASIQDSASYTPGVSSTLGIALATFAALLVASV